ncbi:docking protein 1 [Trematomus bernacchii]|uniref:docking protein 1 n=1 Tax=Trematomus bernacchii TaxID=40690 RepID=UPI00146C950F|nr:docking protein 1 [Trematomus bernacchii]
MDPETKTGKAYLQPHKAGKKWKPVWLSLFPPCSGGGRLEIQDMGGAGGEHVAGVRRHHQPHGDRKLKVVQLSELISVLRLPPNAEACPMENMSAFCVETRDRTMVFAALKDDCVEWVEKLCPSTFQKGDGSGSTQIQMEENHIYASVDEASEFWVTVQRTDAASRCGLKGAYWLQVGREALLLRETEKKNTVREWPYELLRRYGKDKLALTIEAGRRCNSGPGTFSFETQQAEKIFSLIQSTIKSKTSTVHLSNQNQEGEKVIVTRIGAHSPLPKIPDGTFMAAVVENKVRAQESKSAASEESAHAQGESVCSSESVSVQPAPITLMPLPLVPTHNSHCGAPLGGQSEAVYADPADCMQSVPKMPSATALYVDPACVLPLKPPGLRESVTPINSSAQKPCFTTHQPESVYSEVYDKIHLVQDTVTQRKGKCIPFASDEPIYAEPIRKKEAVSHTNESKPDPYAHLYAQVCKTKPPFRLSSSWNTTPSCSASSSSLTDSMSTENDDIIYENLGII